MADHNNPLESNLPHGPIDVNLVRMDSELISAFQSEMKELKDLMRDIKSGLRGDPLNTASGEGASRPEAGESRSHRSGGASTGPVEVRGVGAMDIAAHRQAEDEAWLRETGRPSSRWGRFMEGLATPGAQPSQDPLGYGGGVSPGASRGGGDDGTQALTDRPWWASRLRNSINDPITMPRFGEFTIQDTMNMLSNTIGWGAEKMRNSGSGMLRGASHVPGSVAGFLDVAQNYAPYMAQVEQAVGMPLHLPFQMGAYGREQLQISGGWNPPGIPVHFGAGMGQAYKQGLSDIWAGISTPGYSIGDAKNMRDALLSQGIGKGGEDQEFTRIFNGVRDLDKQWAADGVAKPHQDLIAQISSQMFRYNSVNSTVASFEDLDDIIRTMGETATSAGLEVDEFAQQSIALAEALEDKGLTFAQGMRAASTFSQTTGLAPGLASSFMEDPYVQMNLMGTTGLLPEHQGLGVQQPGAFNQSILESIKQYRGIFGGLNQDTTYTYRGQEYTLSGRDADLAMIANQMGVSPEVVQDVWKNRQEIGAETDISQRLFAMRDERSNLLAKAGGDPGDARYQRLMGNLMRGTGRYADGKLPSMDETIEKLRKYEERGLIKMEESDWEDIEAPQSARSQMKAIEKVLAESSRERATPEVTVGFTGLASKVLRQIIDPEQRQEQRQAFREGRYEGVNSGVNQLFRGAQAVTLGSVLGSNYNYRHGSNAGASFQNR